MPFKFNPEASFRIKVLHVHNWRFLQKNQTLVVLGLFVAFICKAWLFAVGIYIFRPPAPIYIWQPRPQFVFSSPGPQFVLTGPQPLIRICRPWLIKAGNNKSQGLHIMLLFLFLLSNSFVTVIGYYSLLL